MYSEKETTSEPPLDESGMKSARKQKIRVERKEGEYRGVERIKMCEVVDREQSPMEEWRRDCTNLRGAWGGQEGDRWPSSSVSVRNCSY